MRYTTLGLLLLFGVSVPTLAGETAEGFCRIVLAEETRDRELITRDIDEAVSHREATERIFALVEILWEKEAIEKLRYLGFKHERDTSVLSEKRHRTRLARQQSMMTQYEALCDDLSGSSSADPGERVAAAYDAYAVALCEGYGVDMAIAETDRDYDVAVLESFRDLRKNNAATEVDIIVSERSLAMSEKRLAWARDRVAECTTGTAAASAETD